MSGVPDKPQLDRFKEAAREHGADVPEAEFDRALRKVASAPPAPMPKAESGKRGGRKASPGALKEALKNGAENRRKGVKVGR